MNWKRILTSSVIITLSWFVGQACSRKPGEELQKILAQEHLPFRMTAAANRVSDADDGQLVSFSDCEFRINPSFMSAINPVFEKMMGDGMGKLVVPAKEAVFRYQPGKKLEWVSVSGIGINIDETLFAHMSPKIEAGPELSITVERMDLKNADFSPFLDKKLTDGKKLFQALLASNSSYQATVTGLQGKVTAGKKADSSKGQFVFAVGSMSVAQSVAAELISSLYFQTPGDWLKKLLAENGDLFKVDLQLQNLTASGTIPAKAGEVEKSFAFRTDSLAIGYDLVPTADKNAFQFSSQSRVSGLKLDLPHMPAMSRILDISNLSSSFSLSPLSEKLVSLYLDLTRMAMQAGQSGAQDEKAKQELNQKMMPLIMAMSGEFFNSKPVLKTALDPLDHAWTRILAKAEFSLPSMMGPVGSAELNVSRAPELIDTLIRELAMPADKAKQFRDFVARYLIIDAAGNGRLLFEMKAEAPGKPVVNGIPIQK